MSDRLLICLLVTCLVPVASYGQNQSDRPTTKHRPMHQESAQRQDEPPPPDIEPAALPEGMSLDEVLDYSASPPPETFPDPVPDNDPYMFILFDQLEYRIADDDTRDRLGWEAQGYFGGDISKFWWKNEGEAIFEGEGEGETETDLLYSRLVTPFWNAQAGVRYASEWGDDYDDTWSAVLALQGLAPYKFELDNSLYLSEDGDVSFEWEAEYAQRITQRLVLVPRTELTFYAQDIPERDVGAGLSDVNLDLRLRYEIKREFAPYVGVRYHFLTGETDHIAEAAGEDTEQVFLLLGGRLAF